MRVIVTGVTGMVGEGVMLECLENPAVDHVLAVSRKPTDHVHPKLAQLLVPDFRTVADVEDELRGYDACFYCAGISSAGMTEADYTVVTYDTPVAFATTLARVHPGMVLVHVMKLFLPALTLEQVGRAMIRCVTHGAPKRVLEVPDIAALAAGG